MRNSPYFDAKPLSITLCLSLMLPFFAAAPGAAAAPSMDDALARIAQYAPQALAEQGAPGMSVAITDRTHTLRIITAGYANLESKAPVTEQTRFPVGSITKGMTATALMELRDEGKFDLAKPVKAYLPWFSIAADGQPIFAHQVLSHTAGLPDDYTLAPGYMYSVAALRHAHTIFTPGTKWSYSNDGLATAGAILAALDRRAWADSLQARVFNALGMSHSSAYFTPATLADAASGYTFADMNNMAPPNPRLVPTDPSDFVDPAGSVISTPEDMAKYMRFILNGGTNAEGKHVLSSASYTLLTTPDDMSGKPAGPSTPELAEAPLLYQHYALGLAVHTENGDKIVGHTGGIAGYTACMENDVTRGFGVIAMSNLVEAPLHPCAIVLYAIKVLQAQSAGQPLPPVPPLQGMYLQRTTVANAADYAGTYTAPNGAQIAIAADGPGLVLQAGGDPKPLYPRGGTTFYVDDARFAVFGLTFGKNKAGKIDEVFSGDQWFTTSAYTGPKSFNTPRAWEALTGRYESMEEWGFASASRVFVLKGRLVMDGAPLTAEKDGSFRLGSSIVRFDTPAAGKMQRAWVDGIPMYRVELP
jgi:D-alanyl-D-alanine carboxypeptidase